MGEFCYGWRREAGCVVVVMGGRGNQSGRTNPRNHLIGFDKLDPSQFGIFPIQPHQFLMAA